MDIEKTDKYGDNILWFLDDVAAADPADLDYPTVDVYGEDENGNEGSCSVCLIV